MKKNCLFVAIFHKLKNIRTKVFLILRLRIIPHFIWECDGKYYHYTYKNKFNNENSKWYREFLFDGKIEVLSQKYINKTRLLRIM